MADTTITPYTVASDELLDRASTADATMSKIDAFQKIVQKHLKDGFDYGKIPGTQKKTLLLPGAQKIFLVAGVAVDLEVTSRTEDWRSDPPFFAYEVQATAMHNGVIVAKALGAANTAETKYARTINGAGNRFRADKGETPDSARHASASDLQNTVLKMAGKRAEVALGNHIGALSGIFEQDLDAEAAQVVQADAETIADNKPITASQRGLVLALKDELDINDSDFADRLERVAHVRSVDDLKRGQATKLIEKLKAAKDAPKPEVSTEDMLRDQMGAEIIEPAFDPDAEEIPF